MRLRGEGARGQHALSPFGHQIPSSEGVEERDWLPAYATIGQFTTSEVFLIVSRPAAAAFFT
jgi:hypothetical protein